MSEFMDRLYAIEEDEIHLFFLIDCSESMIGAPIREVNKAMTIMLPTMVKVALAKEVMLMFHVLGYNDTVHWLCGSTAENGVPMDQFQWHEISAGGGNNTAGAIRAILPGLSRRLLGHTHISPIIILITDGKSESFQETEAAIQELSARAFATRIAFGVKEYNPRELENFASYNHFTGFDEFGNYESDELRRFVFPVDEAAKRIEDVIRSLTLGNGFPPVQLEEGNIEIEIPDDGWE